MSHFSTLHIDDLNARLCKYKYQIHTLNAREFSEPRLILSTHDATDWAEWMHAKARAVLSMPDTHQPGERYRMSLVCANTNEVRDHVDITFLKDGTWKLDFPPLVHTSEER